jgi:hypothetical protein
MFRSICILAMLAITYPGRSSVSQSSPNNLIFLHDAHILEVRNGAPGTLATIAGTPVAIASASDNRGYVVFHESTYNRVRLSRFHGSWSTIVSWVDFVAPMEIDVDQNGDYLIGNNRLLRVSSGKVTTLSTASVQGFCDDLQRGGWYGTSLSQLIHIARDGTATSILGVSPSAFGGHMWCDRRTGDVFVQGMVGTPLWHYDPVLQRMTSLSASPVVNCVGVDPNDGTLVLGGRHTFRADRSGRVVSTIFPGLNVADLEIARQRHVCGLSSPRPGSRYSLLVSFPRFPGSGYALGASFGFRPGIPTGAGVIPLNADPLLAMSLSNPVYFSGFLGTLDVRGEAAASIAVPGAVPRGTRFFLAGIVPGTGGQILEMSGALGVTVE